MTTFPTLTPSLPDPTTLRVPKPAPGRCGCGCDASVARRYLPGHDAVHKSRLVACAQLSPNWWVREAAVAELAEAGWIGYLPVAFLAHIPVRSRFRGRFVEIRHVRNLGRSLLDPQLDTQHSHSRCPAIADRASLIRQDGRGSGWLCPVCIHTADWTELAHGQALAKAADRCAREATADDIFGLHDERSLRQFGSDRPFALANRRTGAKPQPPFPQSVWRPKGTPYNGRPPKRNESAPVFPRPMVHPTLSKPHPATPSTRPAQLREPRVVTIGASLLLNDPGLAVRNLTNQIGTPK